MHTETNCIVVVVISVRLSAKYKEREKPLFKLKLNIEECLTLRMHRNLCPLPLGMQSIKVDRCYQIKFAE